MAELEWSPGTGAEVWAMLRGADVGDLATVRELVECRPALVNCCFAYRTPLHFAVREGRLEVAAYLLGQGADAVNMVDGDGFLRMARERHHDALVRLLEAHLLDKFGICPEGAEMAAAMRAGDVARALQVPGLLAVADQRGNRAIHWAVLLRRIDWVDALLELGAGLETQRPDGARPLQLVNGDYHFRGWRDVDAESAATPEEMLRHLLVRGAEMDICTASYLGDAARVKQLLAEDPGRANRTVDYVTYYLGSGSPLRNAAARGRKEVVEILLAAGADPNLREEGIAPRGAALYEAAAAGWHDIARLLLRHGADPNAAVESSADCLSRAIQNKDERMIELLRSYGARRPIHLIAYYGDTEALAAMREIPADPGAVASAAENGHDEFVRMILARWPQIASDVHCAGAKTRELTEYLFAAGMNPSHRDWQGATPLHEQAGRGDLRNAELYLHHGAELEARDDEWRSRPLGWAAREGKLDMVDFLLQHGALAAHPDDEDWATPLAWAESRGHQAVASRLREAIKPEFRPGS